MNNEVYKGSVKKSVFYLVHIEKCVFLPGVQHVSNITLQVFSSIVKFWSFLLYLMGILKVKIFLVLKDGSKLVLEGVSCRPPQKKST